MYTNRELGYELFLAHHGVKGMKWGVRKDRNKTNALQKIGYKQAKKEAAKLGIKAGKKIIENKSNLKNDVSKYQNPDGTLNEKGKKRYYDEHGFLTDHAKTFNKKNDELVDRVVNASNKDNIKKAADYDNLVRLEAKNRDHYLRNRDQWFRQEGKYKNKDYYQFKDIAYKDWLGTKEGQAQDKALKHMRSLIDDGMKNVSVNGQRKYQQILMSGLETRELGEVAAGRLFNQIYMDMYDDSAKYTTYKEDKGGK